MTLLPRTTVGGSYHCRRGYYAGACTSDYVITRTFPATDDCGNAQALRRRLRLSTRRCRTLAMDTQQSVLTSTVDDATAADNCGG